MTDESPVQPAEKETATEEETLAEKQARREKQNRRRGRRARKTVLIVVLSLAASPPVAARLQPMHAQTFGHDFLDRHARREAAVRILEDDLQIAAERTQRAALLIVDAIAQKDDAPL